MAWALDLKIGAVHFVVHRKIPDPKLLKEGVLGPFFVLSRA